MINISTLESLKIINGKLPVFKQQGKSISSICVCDRKAQTAQLSKPLPPHIIILPPPMEMQCKIYYLNEEETHQAHIITHTHTERNSRQRKA